MFHDAPHHHAPSEFVHPGESLELLVMGTFAVVLGPVVFSAVGRVRGASAWLSAALGVVVGALVLFEILPHCVEAAGGVAVVVAMLGLAGPLLAERLERRGGHAGGHHALSVSLWIGLAGVLLHALFDGAALASGAGPHGHGVMSGLTTAVVLHRIPEGAAIWWLFRPRGRMRATTAILLDMTASAVGFFAVEAVLPIVGSLGMTLVQAFVAGVLLHALFHGAERRSAPAALQA